MPVTWAQVRGHPRLALFADVNGYRLHVEQTVQSANAHGIAGDEYRARVAGVRIGDFDGCAAAMRAAIDAAQTKKAPRSAGP